MSRTDLGTNVRCEQGGGASVYWRRFKGPIFFATHGRRKGRMRPFDDNGDRVARWTEPAEWVHEQRHLDAGAIVQHERDLPGRAS